MTPAAPLAGVLAGLALWSLRLAWAATRAARVRGRFPAPGAAPVGPTLPRPLARPPEALKAALIHAGVPWSPAAVWQGWLGGGAFLLGGGWVIGGPALAAVAAVVVVAVPVGVLRAAAGRGDRLLEAGVPVVLERIARSLRSGSTLGQALQEAASESRGQLGVELRHVMREVAAGEPLVDALDRWATRRPLPAIRLAVAALALGAETGGGQAQALDGLAATLRDRLAVAAEVKALSSQARLSALVISLAPLGFALFATATDPRSADFLFRTPAGIACLCIGLALDGIAAWWMARLTRTPA